MLKLVSDNGWSRSARPSDLHSNCAENHFGNKTRFSEKHDFFNFFGFWPQKFLTSDDIFAALLTKLRFASPEHNLIFFFDQFSICSSISRFEKKINFFTQNYRRSCQKCNLRVQMTIWWKTGFPLRSVIVFLSPRVFKQELCGIFGS